MVKFARDCMYKTTEIVCSLEETLGPGTEHLRMRFGLHSGPVTAGVLRGEKSRFQLFGDTGTYYMPLPNPLRVDVTTHKEHVATIHFGFMSSFVNVIHS